MNDKELEEVVTAMANRVISDMFSKLENSSQKANHILPLLSHMAKGNPVEPKIRAVFEANAVLLDALLELKAEVDSGKPDNGI